MIYMVIIGLITSIFIFHSIIKKFGITDNDLKEAFFERDIKKIDKTYINSEELNNSFEHEGTDDYLFSLLQIIDQINPELFDLYYKSKKPQKEMVSDNENINKRNKFAHLIDFLAYVNTDNGRTVSELEDKFNISENALFKRIESLMFQELIQKDFDKNGFLNIKTTQKGKQVLLYYDRSKSIDHSLIEEHEE